MVPVYLTARWRDFIAGGELARMLTRLCGAIDGLAYSLVRHEGQLDLTLARDGEPAKTMVIATPDDRTAHQLPALLAAISEGWPEALELAWKDDVCQVVWAGRAAVELQLPTAQGEDGTVAGLVAAYIQRLARFAGLTDVTCEPAAWQADQTLRFSITQHAEDGVTRILEVPANRLDPQPILDMLNRFVRAPEARRLYRAARDPDRIDVVFVDKGEAIQLRKRGGLIEHPAREALSALADAGVELPGMVFTWRKAGPTLVRILKRLVNLTRGIVEVSVEVDHDDRAGTCVLAWKIGGRERVTKLGADRADRHMREVVPVVIAELNRGLADLGSPWRAVLATGGAFFPGVRAFFLESAWLWALARGDTILPGCLDERTHAVLGEELGCFPPRELIGHVPRTPPIEELIKRDSILETTFKVRQSEDVTEYIQAIARFARVALQIRELSAGENAEQWVYEVSYRGETTEIRFEGARYLDVSPLLDFLNEQVLATRAPRVRLYDFFAGEWTTGLVRVTDAEAAELRAAGYIS